MLNAGEYEITYCKIHIKHIYSFRQDSHRRGFHCWDCSRDENQKKSKQERALLEARGQFCVDYSHLWNNNLTGGIVEVKIKEGGLTVQIASSPEASQQIPETYQDFHITKEIVGDK